MTTTKVKYNIHRAINMRSWRKGLVTDESLNFDMKYNFCNSRYLTIYGYPAPTYGIYYPNVYGKKHSQYPK